MGQKLGYDRCPYLSFFVQRCKGEIFALMGKKRLKYRVHLFLTPRYAMNDAHDDMLWYAVICDDMLCWEMRFTGEHEMIYWGRHYGNTLTH